MTSEPAPRSGWRAPNRFVVAVAAACLYGVVLYVLGRLAQPDSGLLLLSFLLGVPLATCVLAVVLSDPAGQRPTGHHFATGFIVVTMMMLASYALLREGVVCVLMASPIFYLVGCSASVFTGALLRRRTRRRGGVQAFCFTALLVPMLGLPLEQQAGQPVELVTVTTTTRVEAPVHRVWSELVEIRDIKPKELGFTVTQDLIGVPKPVTARLEGRGIGAVRHAYWERGVYFREHVTAWEPGRRVAWTFDLPPAVQTALLDDHLRVQSDYLQLRTGEYELRELSGEATQVSLRTTYLIRTPMNAYASAWGKLFLGDFHRNVLRAVEGRSEAVVRAPGRLPAPHA